MKTDITIMESTLHTALHTADDMDDLIKINDHLTATVKRLHKEKEQLIEQMSLLKNFSDLLWERLKVVV